MKSDGKRLRRLKTYMRLIMNENRHLCSPMSLTPRYGPGYLEVTFMRELGTVARGRITISFDDKLLQLLIMTKFSYA